MKGIREILNPLAIDQRKTVCVPNLENILLKLTEKGMPANRLKAKDDLMLLAMLVEQGATAAMISQAYDKSHKATSSRGNKFGIRYLAKFVMEILLKEKQGRSSTVQSVLV